MHNKKFSKRAALTSIIVVILCCALLIGNTFAWFTDSHSSGINTIHSGELDLEVYYAFPKDVVNGEVPENAWKPLTEDTPVFNDEALWEPGYAEVVYFKVYNAGTLSLEYNLRADIVKESGGINVYKQVFNLSDYIMAGVEHGEALAIKADRQAAYNIANQKTLFESANAAIDATGSLDYNQYMLPGETFYTTLVLFMPTEVDNVANQSIHERGKPEIQLGINFVATQYNWEEEFDSFDHNYDADAEFPVVDTQEPTFTGEIDFKDLVTGEGNITIKGENVDATFNAYETYSTGRIDLIDLTGTAHIVLHEDADNTFYIKNCDFDAFSITNNSGYPIQVIFVNVTVGGEPVDSTADGEALILGHQYNTIEVHYNDEDGDDEGDDNQGGGDTGDNNQGGNDDNQGGGNSNVLNGADFNHTDWEQNEYGFCYVHDVEITGTIVIDEYLAGYLLYFENCSGDFTVVLKKSNTVRFDACTLTNTSGTIVDNQTSDTTIQVSAVNHTTVNGVEYSSQDFREEFFN